MTTTTPEPNLQEKESELWAMIIAIVVLLWMVFMWYNTYLNSENISDLREKHYDLSGKVSWIDITLTDVNDQQMEFIKDFYRWEIDIAINIASSEWYYNYRFVSISGYNLSTVRLKSIDWLEINVNIHTKTITIYQPL